MDLAVESDAVEIQDLLNGPKTGEYLGGAPYLKTLQHRIRKGDVAVVRNETGMIVATNEVTFDHFHRIRMQDVAVHPSYRRIGLATSLYYFWATRGILEGRFQMVDTIVGGHPIMPNFLKRFYFHRSATMSERVLRQHDMQYFFGQTRDVIIACSNGLLGQHLDLTYELWEPSVMHSNFYQAYDHYLEMNPTWAVRVLNDRDDLIMKGELE